MTHRLRFAKRWLGLFVPVLLVACTTSFGSDRGVAANEPVMQAFRSISSGCARVAEAGFSAEMTVSTLGTMSVEGVWDWQGPSLFLQAVSPLGSVMSSLRVENGRAEGAGSDLLPAGWGDLLASLGPEAIRSVLCGELFLRHRAGDLLRSSPAAAWDESLRTELGEWYELQTDVELAGRSLVNEAVVFFVEGSRVVTLSRLRLPWWHTRVAEGRWEARLNADGNWVPHSLHLSSDDNLLIFDFLDFDGRD